jgi:hypothetical protein
MKQWLFLSSLCVGELFASFLTSQIRGMNQTLFSAMWIGGYLKKIAVRIFFKGYCALIITFSLHFDAVFVTAERVGMT